MAIFSSTFYNDLVGDFTIRKFVAYNLLEATSDLFYF